MTPGSRHPVARRGLPASSKDQGKALAVVAPPLKMDKELAWWLQQEEIAVK